MRIKNGIFVLAVALGVGISFVIPVTTHGQDAPGDAPKDGKGGFGGGKGGGKGKGAPPPPAGPITRLPDGHPDLQGY